MNKTYIGIDNGVTGSVGIIKPNNSVIFFQTPTTFAQTYTKTKANVSRIDHKKLLELLIKDISKKPENNLFVLERPMVNYLRFKSSMVAVRALEATLIVIEIIGSPFVYEDSKKWQKILLPIRPKIKGESSKERSKKLKKDSLDVGIRLFPTIADQFSDDADSILIAEYARRMNF